MKLDYKNMIVDAQKKGLATEPKMWKSIEAMEPMLVIMEEEHPDEYWCMMRKLHEVLHGPHYDEDFAEWDVSNLIWTDRDGQRKHGPHWTKAEVLSATAGMNFPNGTTSCDKYVAFNSYYADMNHDKDDETVLKDAHRFFFLDEDAPEGKIWRYVKSMHMKY